MTVGFTELFIMLAVLLLAGCVQPFKMYSTSHSCGNTPLGHTSDDGTGTVHQKGAFPSSQLVY
jgi:hypothetical protein